ncbi:MAG: hypothetical protein ABWY66_11805 [Xanthobacteraceae bacterium]|jgi:hypothetical protein|nr:hypothetical protein [Xanthobacteraceae bacterium]
MDKPTENALAIIGPHKPKASTTDQPLPLDGQLIDAEAKTITIDLTAIGTRIEPPETETIERDGNTEQRFAPDAGDPARRKFPLLAASLAFAVIVGGLAGVAVSAVLSGAPPAAPAAAVALTDETRTLQERVVRLSGELATLKAGIEAANRTSATQLNKISERLDRAEKAQIEPTAKLAKISESLDRLERRTASAATPDVTGSVTSVEKQQSKPPVIEGWMLRDYYAGRAVLENRNGRLYEVGPGSNLPGVGQIETIKRVDGKVVVTTPKGIITSSLEPPRRPAYHLPRGY